jgi:hypothetical protein
MQPSQQFRQQMHTRRHHHRRSRSEPSAWQVGGKVEYFSTVASGAQQPQRACSKQGGHRASTGGASRYHVNPTLRDGSRANSTTTDGVYKEGTRKSDITEGLLPPLHGLESSRKFRGAFANQIDGLFDQYAGGSGRRLSGSGIVRAKGDSLLGSGRGSKALCSLLMGEGRRESSEGQEEEFEKLRLLGTGSYGVVTLVKSKRDDK